MRYKTIMLTLLLTTGFTFSKCTSEELPFFVNDVSDNCPTALGYFDIIGMVLINLADDGDESAPRLATNQTASVEDYVLRVHYEVDYVAQRDWSFSLMSSALANNCPPSGEEGSKTQRLTQFEITTVDDFDAEHPAGSSLLDVLTVYRNDDWRTMDAYLAGRMDNFIPSIRMDMRLTKRPNNDRPFRARVLIGFSSGENYNGQTQAVFLTD